MRAILSRSFASSTQQNEIIGIQCMRYFAALAVLVDHLVVSMCANGKLPPTLLPFAYKLGDAGVFLFFAISGFVMVLTNRDRFHSPRASLDFFLRRLIRIWPMYFIATLIVFVLKYGSDPSNNFENLFKSLAFIPYSANAELYRPILGKGWTLNYEIFFYAIFAFCLALPKRKGLILAGAILLALGLSDGLFSHHLVRFYADDIVLYFLVGLLVGALTSGTKVDWFRFKSAGAAVSIAMTIFILLFTLNTILRDGWIKNLLLLVGTFLCLFTVCFKETKFRSKKFAKIMAISGDASYCLYLFHGFFFFGLQAVFVRVPSGGIFIIMAITVAVVSIGCTLIHLLCEKPINSRLITFYKAKVTAEEIPVSSAAQR